MSQTYSVSVLYSHVFKYPLLYEYISIAKFCMHVLYPYLGTIDNPLITQYNIKLPDT